MRDIENLRRLRREAEKQRLRKQARHEEIKQYIIDLKNSSVCADCGKSYPHYVMDFDHLQDKKFNVGSHNGSKSLKTVKAEIAKCELVCANCHRIRTHGGRSIG